MFCCQKAEHVVSLFQHDGGAGWGLKGGGGWLTLCQLEKMPSYFTFLLLYFPFRFITPEDEHWFNVHLLRAIEESTGSDMTSYIFPEPYFVDFLREMPEPTGDEPEDTVFEIPKIYELVFILTFEEFFRSLT